MHRIQALFVNGQVTSCRVQALFVNGQVKSYRDLAYLGR